MILTMEHCSACGLNMNFFLYHWCSIQMNLSSSHIDMCICSAREGTSKNERGLCVNAHVEHHKVALQCLLYSRMIINHIVLYKNDNKKNKQRSRRKLHTGTNVDRLTSNLILIAIVLIQIIIICITWGVGKLKEWAHIVLNKYNQGFMRLKKLTLV